MRVLSAILHFAEQILFGDDEHILLPQREKAWEDLQPLAQEYLQYWAGGPLPRITPPESDSYLQMIYALFAGVSKTNAHLNEEVLSFRFDGSILDGHQYPKKPYAIFYLWNDHFFGYHIRFQEIARGGLRTVVPRSADQEEHESCQIFCECY